MARRAVTATIHIGDAQPVTGELCPTCQLPTLITLPIYSLCGHGIRHIATWTGCRTPTCPEGDR